MIYSPVDKSVSKYIIYELFPYKENIFQCFYEKSNEYLTWCLVLFSIFSVLLQNVHSLKSGGEKNGNNIRYKLHIGDIKIKQLHLMAGFGIFTVIVKDIFPKAITTSD